MIDPPAEPDYDDEIEKELIRYTPDGNRAIDYPFGQMPDRPEYPYWELPWAVPTRLWVGRIPQGGLY